MADPFKISWSPTNVNGAQKIGLFAFQNATGIPGITSITIKHVTNDQGWDLENCPDLVTVSWPYLQTLTGAAYLELLQCPNLTSIQLPQLATIDTGSLLILNNTSLVTFSLPAYVSGNISNPIQVAGNTALTILSLPSWQPSAANTNLNFSNNALSAFSVNAILAKCVTNPAYGPGCVLNLGSGTNAAPTGQGIIDKATLIGRGCIVSTN